MAARVVARPVAPLLSVALATGADYGHGASGALPIAGPRQLLPHVFFSFFLAFRSRRATISEVEVRYASVDNQTVEERGTGSRDEVPRASVLEARLVGAYHEVLIGSRLAALSAGDSYGAKRDPEKKGRLCG